MSGAGKAQNEMPPTEPKVTIAVPLATMKENESLQDSQQPASAKEPEDAEAKKSDQAAPAAQDADAAGDDATNDDGNESDGGSSKHDERPRNKRGLDMYLIHGLNSDNNTAWGTGKVRDPDGEPIPGNAWFREIFEETMQEGHNPTEHGAFEYNASNPMMCFRPAFILKEASNLLDYILLTRGGPNNASTTASQPNPIAFLAHDLGGIIVKFALVLAFLQPEKYISVTQCTRLLVFFGVPNRSRSLEDMEIALTQYFDSSFPELHGRSKVPPAAVTSFAKTIIDINHAFVRTRTLNRAAVVEVMSTAEYAEHFVFTPYSLLWRIPFEKLCASPKDHRTMTQKDEPFFWAENVAQLLDRIFLSEAERTMEHTLQTLAPPVTPLGGFFGEDIDFKFLKDHEVFNQWISVEPGHGLLHLYGHPRISHAAEWIFISAQAAAIPLKLNIEQDVLMFFRFDCRDARRNNIRAMIDSLCAQLLTQYRLASRLLGHQDEVKRPEFYEAWTDRDAYMVLFQLYRIIGSQSAKIVVVLDRLDECEPSSRDSFLRELAFFHDATDGYFKTVITSSSADLDADLQKLVPGSLSINMGDDPEDLRLDGHVRDLAGQLTLLYSGNSLIEIDVDALDKLRDGCGTDYALLQMVLNWLRFSRPLLRSLPAIKQEIERISPPDPATFIDRVLEEVPVENREWAARIISWLLFSARSLGPYELTTAMSMSEPSRSSEALRDSDGAPEVNLATDQIIMDRIKEVFGPLIYVDLSGSVNFVHPYAYTHLKRTTTTNSNATQEAEGNESKAEARPWYRPDPLESHKMMAKACLEYLTGPGVTDRMKNIHQAAVDFTAAQPESPFARFVLDSDFDFLAYAIQYWPTHIKHLHDASEPMLAELKAFLSNESSRPAWAALNKDLSNPYDCDRDQTHDGAVAIIQRFGLVKYLPPAKIELDYEDEERHDLFVLSAKHGHLDSVQTRLKYLEASSSSVLKDSSEEAPRPVADVLRTAIVHAAMNNHSTIVEFLAYHAIENNIQIEWHTSLVCRIVFLGLRALIGCLIDLGVSFDTEWQESNPSGNIPPDYALVNHDYETLSFLLKRKVFAADLKRPPGCIILAPLQMAIFVGDGRAVKALLDAGADKDDKAGDVFVPLNNAIWYGTHQTLKVLVEAGVSLEPLSENNGFPVYDVARRGYNRCMAVLLEAGMKPMFGGEDTAPRPLAAAAAAGRMELCRMLLDAGADPNEVTEPVDKVREKDRRPLTSAVESRSLPLVKMLVERGAEINVGAHRGLAGAIRSRSLPMVEFFLEKGADVEHGNNRGWNALHEAACANVFVDLLLPRMKDIDAECSDGTALYMACWYNSLESAKLLLDAGANMEYRLTSTEYNDGGYTPLLAAAYRGHRAIFEMLLERGANINVAGKDGFPVLYLLLSSRKEDMLRIALEYTPDLNARDESDRTVMHLLVNDTKESMIRRLYNRGAPLDAIDKYGRTPLWEAIAEDNRPCALFFVSMGANVEHVHKTDGTMLMKACRQLHKDFMRLLIISGGADVNRKMDMLYGNALQTLCSTIPEDDKEEERVLDLVKYLIEEAKADVNASCGRIGSTLAVAAYQGMPGLLRYLLDQGAELEHEDEFKRRAIHAASTRPLNRLQVLLDAGAEVNVKDRLGRTPLHTAAVGGKLESVTRILELMPPEALHEPDDDGWTPLHWAARYFDSTGVTLEGQREVVQFLVEKGADIWAMAGPGGRQMAGSRVGSGLSSTMERKWSPLRIARYCGASEETIALLIPKEKERKGQDGVVEVWEEEMHASRTARSAQIVCSACLTGLWGVNYKCAECNSFELCFKCYASRDTLHPGHNWEPEGEEFAPDDEELGVGGGDADGGPSAVTGEVGLGAGDGAGDGESYVDEETDDLDDEDDDDDDDEDDDDDSALE